MHQPFRNADRTASVRPIRRPKQRTPEALAACQALSRELDAWCRERGLPAIGNREVAEVAVDQVWARPCDERIFPADLVSAGGDILPDQLRRWPARWRYLVAELERGGMERTTAVEVVRWGAEGVGAEVPARQPAA